MSILASTIGTIGIAMGIAGYAPQVAHLVKEKCSEGISGGAYVTWATAATLLLLYAILKRDPVFVSLQACHACATLVICYFCNKYKDHPCAECAEEASRQFLPQCRACDLAGGTEGAQLADGRAI